eukprot:1159917-Pelagomonas_calceolata.AAC.4
MEHFLPAPHDPAGNVWHLFLASHSAFCCFVESPLEEHTTPHQPHQDPCIALVIRHSNVSLDPHRNTKMSGTRYH